MRGVRSCGLCVSRRPSGGMGRAHSPLEEGGNHFKPLTSSRVIQQKPFPSAKVKRHSISPGKFTSGCSSALVRSDPNARYSHTKRHGSRPRLSSQRGFPRAPPPETRPSLGCQMPHETEKMIQRRVFRKDSA